MKNPLKYFAELRDPHVERNREHLLQEILLICHCDRVEPGGELERHGSVRRGEACLVVDVSDPAQRHRAQVSGARRLSLLEEAEK